MPPISPPPPTASSIAPTWDPPATQAPRRGHTFEAQVTGLVDATTVTTDTILMFDEVTGYLFTPAFSVIQNGGNSRIVIKPDRELEYGHSIRIEVTNGVKYSTTGQAVGPFQESWTVEAGARPRMLMDQAYFTLLLTRFAATAPYDDAYDDSGVANHIKHGILNDPLYGATFANTQTPNATVGAPATHDAALAAHLSFRREMSYAFNLTISWHRDGTTAHKAKAVAFIVDWVDNFSIEPKYTDEGFAEDGILWAIDYLQMIIVLDLLWDEASSFTDQEAARVMTHLRIQADWMATKWFPIFDTTIEKEWPTLSDAGCQWMTTMLFAVGCFLGDHKIRAFASDGSDQPTTAWVVPERTFDVNRDKLWNADGSYRHEARDEEGNGEGWQAGVDAMLAQAAMFLLVSNHEVGYDLSWDVVNEHTQTLELTGDWYANYIDGGTSWETDRGYRIGQALRYLNVFAFFPLARFYRNSNMRDLLEDDHGDDVDLNQMIKPWPGGRTWPNGGPAFHLPVAAAVTGTDTTDPNNVTSLSSPTKGATWAELAWTRSVVVDEDDIPKYYRIYETAPGSLLRLTVTGADAVVNGLVKNTAYTFSVRAVDGSNNEASGVTQAVTTDDADS